MSDSSIALLTKWATTEAERLSEAARAVPSPLGEHRDLSGIWAYKVFHHVSAALEFLRVHAGESSGFYRTAHYAFDPESHKLNAREAILAVAVSLEQWAAYVQSDVGGILPYEARARQDAANDLMEQVQSLLDDTSVHPAAPIMLAGAALEEFLRALISVNGCTIVGKLGIGSYAGGLRSADLISAQDAKDITAWAGQRNDAAHGNFGGLTRPRAQVMADGINLFIRQYSASRTPAASPNSP